MVYKMGSAAKTKTPFLVVVIVADISTVAGTETSVLACHWMMYVLCTPRLTMDTNWTLIVCSEAVSSIQAPAGRLQQNQETQRTILGNNRHGTHALTQNGSKTDQLSPTPVR